ncbi:hypothetical protein JL107_07200 [Nakamurella flavida]|uniref:Uncharacterized protein n=1 Tax=Nakamurella flavida TaxID=363630 RepID=A0A938YHW6_9ACTN|nr:DUF5708 family protein [Nakamurella flavida]MBM9476227.1 hypothetical protein [Nakamurella flavida]MDP9779675.1 hypothetical protein [Nakamurella flavida]
MSTDKLHLLTGGTLIVIGVVLALTTRGVRTPIVTLDKLGIVLAVLGAIEVAVTAVIMARAGRGGRAVR